MNSPSSIAVIGAGIIGAATARELQRRYPGATVRLYDKENRLAAHQTGRNSGVVHAGLYYEPGSLKAQLCRRGVSLLREFSAEHGVEYDACGKVVVATTEVEKERLAQIFSRAQANGVPRVEAVDRDRLKEIEPKVEGIAAVYSPETAIIDYSKVTAGLVDDFLDLGGELSMSTEIFRLVDDGDKVVVESSRGRERYDTAIVCGGLQSDRLARASGEDAYPKIVPFFGQYLRLESKFNSFVNGLVYPVPDPAYPFLGVHITRRIDGDVMIGPNAFLSLSREGYRALSMSVADIADVVRSKAFWKFAQKNMHAALDEFSGVVSNRKFVRGAARFIPELADAEVSRLPRGIRAQAMNEDGSLVDDFVIQQQGRATFLRNAPSPGATSSLAIAEYLSDHIASVLGYELKSG